MVSRLTLTASANRPLSSSIPRARNSARSAMSRSRSRIATAMSSSVAASSSTSARSGARTIATGSAGRTSALTSSATPPPVSASRKRSKVTPSVGGCSVATSAAETAAWVASICPLPRKIASAVASITTSESCAAPTPMPSTSRSPTAIPSATPIAISTARRPRSEIVSPSVTIADTGAKNGCSCPNTSVAITHATPAATPGLEHRAPGDPEPLEAGLHRDPRALGRLLDQRRGAVAQGRAVGVSQARHRRV